jgi:TonB family protein
MRRPAALAATVAALAAAAAGAAWWRENTRWFTAAEIDAPAQPAGFITPNFPQGPRGTGYLGRLRIDVYIDAAGKVSRVEVVESTLPPVFAERAVEAFAAARFEPARRFGRAVRSVKRLELDIEPPAPGGGRGG